LRFLYNILTHIADFHIKIIGNFNYKLGLGVKGRKQTFDILKSTISQGDQTIWFHCASLGEYEQGLPVFEEIRKKHPAHKIVLSFFSPSGYEIRKNSPIADCVVYLPLDTATNAERFLNFINPSLVVFVKYEIWPNYLRALQQRKITSVLISALFKKDQVFFKPQGAWMRKYLKAFDHIFVQNESSLKLIKKYGFNNVSISGDTRFDRVSNQLKVDNSLPFISEFKNNKLCVVAGSTWPEGEKLLIEYINNSNHEGVKFIIAPHNIKLKQIERLKSSINKQTILYSERENKHLKEFDVFIIDTIGILSKIYSYADIAYVGGGLGTSGLHNTLEPAVFGVPIIIGNNFENFPEAKEMLTLGGLFSISDQSAFMKLLDELIQDETKRSNAGEENKSYIVQNQGAVNKIIDYLSSN
jgi:3-deoxy-D-manno-octulosonic-acid transferase